MLSFTIPEIRLVLRELPSPRRFLRIYATVIRPNGRWRITALTVFGSHPRPTLWCATHPQGVVMTQRGRHKQYVTIEALLNDLHAVSHDNDRISIEIGPRNYLRLARAA